ncbi:MAG TPA: hypothetical protein VL443_11390 [Cyclobacteriaceae bacterium]|jgi:hypothetical protein|nr:hypothetical protein [Cyclobacteriaceae bacterium]
MLYLILITVEQIKSVLDECNVENVILESIGKMKIKNVNDHVIERFIDGMGLILKRERKQEISIKSLRNIDVALAFFENYKRLRTNSNH